MTIDIHAFKWLMPLKIEFGHPLAGHIERNQSEDVIAFHHLRFLHKVNNCPGRNMCPNISNVSKQLLDKINIVKEGMAARIFVVMVQECRPITDEILAPHLKLLTAANTLPDNGSSVIGGFSPSFSRCVDGKESIQVI